MAQGNSRKVQVWQEADPKITGNTDKRLNVEYAISPSGKRTFIASERKSPVKSFKTTWEPGKIWSVCNFRLNAIQRLIEGRHSGPCNNDDGIAYFDVALFHLVARRIAMGHGDETVKSLEWAQRWTPDLVSEKGRAWFDEQEAKILVALDCRKRPPLPSADDVAIELNITASEVEAYQMKTIGAVDRRRKVRVTEAKVKDKARKADDRAGSGAAPRAKSMAQTKPWEALGMSRSTYYRAVDRGEIQPHDRMQKGTGKQTKNGNVLRVIRSA